MVEYHYNQHLGLLLIYELPDTVKQKVTEAEAYSTVWDIQMKLQHALPRSVVYYGQDTLKDGGTRYDELGVFLPLDTLPTGWNAMWKLLPRSFTASKRPVNELPL